MDPFHELFHGNSSTTTAIVLSVVPIGGAAIMVIICAGFCVVNFILQKYAQYRRIRHHRNANAAELNAVTQNTTGLNTPAFNFAPLNNTDQRFAAFNAAAQHIQAQHTAGFNAAAQHPTAFSAAAQHPTAFNAAAQHPTAFNAAAQHPTAFNVAAQHPTAFNAAAQHPTAFNAAAQPFNAAAQPFNAAAQHPPPTQPNNGILPDRVQDLDQLALSILSPWNGLRPNPSYSSNDGTRTQHTQETSFQEPPSGIEIPEIPEKPEAQELYKIPSDNVSLLYEQIENEQKGKITRKSIELGDRLGSGHFGEVRKGVWSGPSGRQEVAVKQLKPEATEEQRVKFLQEAAIMTQFDHTNVVTMYGAVTSGDPIMIVLDMLAKGDLKAYLESNEKNRFTEYDLWNYSNQIASGMVYLSNKGFVHRDLAARNVLLSECEICKIADFGLSRELIDEDYYIANNMTVPWRWTAPEAMSYRKFSVLSDVWSFGVVLYEIWTLGKMPYDGINNSVQLLGMLAEGYILPHPSGCPEVIYNIMESTWKKEANERPRFVELFRALTLLRSRFSNNQPYETLERR